MEEADETEMRQLGVNFGKKQADQRRISRADQVSVLRIDFCVNLVSDLLSHDQMLLERNFLLNFLSCRFFVGQFYRTLVCIAYGLIALFETYKTV